MLTEISIVLWIGLAVVSVFQAATRKKTFYWYLAAFCAIYGFSGLAAYYSLGIPQSVLGALYVAALAILLWGAWKYRKSS